MGDAAVRESTRDSARESDRTLRPGTKRYRWKGEIYRLICEGREVGTGETVAVFQAERDGSIWVDWLEHWRAAAKAVDE